jgi:Protein of unknown function (DUF3352)
VRRRLPHGSRPLVLAALLLLLLAALAGCGGEGSSKPAASVGPDPATLAPQGAPVYVEALVRPQGDLAAGVLAAARKVSRVQNPGPAIVGLLDHALAKQHLTYAHDVAPWLGPRAGLFLLRVTRGRIDGAAMLAVRDRAAVERLMAHQRAAHRQRAGGAYRGVSYDVETNGDVDALVGDFYVSGSKRGFEAAVDTWKGAPALAASSRFQDAVKALDPDRLAFAYADPHVIAGQLQAAGAAPPAVQQLLGSAKFAGSAPITLSLTARADQIALQLALGSSLVPSSGSASDTVSLGDLPGDAWLALATPPLGPLIRTALDQAGAHAAAAEQVRTRLGLDLDRDLLDPLGGLAAFARGSSVLDLGGGLLLRMSSAAAAQTLMTRVQAIANAATGGGVRPTAGGFELQAGTLPQPIVVRAQGDRIAAGYAAASANDLLKPQQRFDQSSAGNAAIATLGDGYTPALVVIAPPLVDLLRSLNELQVAKLSPVLPYLAAYRSLAVGTKRDGERTTVRIVAALN